MLTPISNEKDSGLEGETRRQAPVRVSVSSESHYSTTAYTAPIRVFRRNLPVGHPGFRCFHDVEHGDAGFAREIITKTCGHQNLQQLSPYIM
jgi:hypothetical protein